MDNILSKTKKLPRAITMANNWKIKEIKIVLGLRDEMVAHNIDSTMIQEYIDEEYDRINTMYEMRINKYNNKSNKTNKSNKSNKSNKRLRDKAIEFLIKNKNFLEEKGYDSTFINNYVTKHYMVINNKYSSKTETNNNIDEISFID
jgi:hypothetical protein